MRVSSGAAVRRLQSLSSLGSFLAASSMVVTSACAPAPELDWEAVKGLIRAEYPTVDQVSSANLVELLSSTDGKDLILLDVRGPDEYSVSHLRGAQLTPSERSALNVLMGAEKDRLIVVYGSVGYRSASMTERLTARGFTNVHNLEGGLFEWANNDLPRYNGDQQVQVVHPFDSEWGQFLKPDLWAGVIDSSAKVYQGRAAGQH
ncbi:MAG: rhodanese-like domain-containing protein [Gemmatimonadales bacterium]|jgi:rhodanese-related sulfurtransferase